MPDIWAISRYIRMLSNGVVIGRMSCAGPGHSGPRTPCDASLQQAWGPVWRLSTAGRDPLLAHLGAGPIAVASRSGGDGERLTQVRVPTPSPGHDPSSQSSSNQSANPQTSPRCLAALCSFGTTRLARAMENRGMGPWNARAARARPSPSTIGTATPIMPTPNS